MSKKNPKTYTTKEQAVDRWISKWLNTGRNHFRLHLNEQNGLDKVAESMSKGVLWCFLNEVIKDGYNIKTKITGRDKYGQPIHDLDLEE